MSFLVMRHLQPRRDWWKSCSHRSWTYKISRGLWLMRASIDRRVGKNMLGKNLAQETILKVEEVSFVKNCWLLFSWLVYRWLLNDPFLVRSQNRACQIQWLRHHERDKKRIVSSASRIVHGQVSPYSYGENPTSPWRISDQVACYRRTWQPTS